jgi:SAM-dependent methyltransferase
MGDRHDHDHHTPDHTILEGDGPEHWDARYASQEQWWSGNANGTFVVEATDLPPGRALDVGCGEGADAIWLAERGWSVTAVDISQVAIDRARAAADAASFTGVDWVCADVAADPPEAGAYDLVSLQYPALPIADDRTIPALLGAVAAGGTLLVVGHRIDTEVGKARGFDPSAYIQPPDIARQLDDGWTIEVHEDRPRPPGANTTHHVDDVVLRARRH